MDLTLLSLSIKVFEFKFEFYLSLSRERWTYDSVVLPVVNVYKYLDVLHETGFYCIILRSYK